MPPDRRSRETLTMLERLDAACDQFERDWLRGKAPRIEAYLAAAPQGDRVELLRALVGIELELRGRAGQKPDVSEYRARFPQPQAESLIAQVFADFHGHLDRLGTPPNPHSNTLSLSSPAVDTSTPAPPADVPRENLKTLGRFELEEVLGEGAFGTVYRARDPQLDRQVAIKVPRAGVLKAAVDHQRFRREARAAAHLSHPNICPVYEVGAFGGRDYIVMAYVEGKPLAKIIKTGKVKPSQAASAVRKIALALHEAHLKGIVHRDLKPANIMVNRRGEPVVMDFGLARWHKPGDAQLTRSGIIMGSPAYMSPEQARGDATSAGPESDIYSLGVILYEMLTGKRPFEGTVTEVLGKILHVDPEPPSRHRAGIDPRLEAICLKAMAKQPAERYNSMLELAAALGDFLKGRQSTASDAVAPPSAPVQDAGSTALLADVFARVSAGLDRQTVELGQRHRRLAQAIAAGFALTIAALFAGIWFFARGDTVSVVIEIPLDTNDPALSFYLNQKPLSAAELAAPIELKTGNHELTVYRNGQFFKRFRFAVSGSPNEKIAVKDVTPVPPPIIPAKPVTPEPAQPAALAGAQQSPTLATLPASPTEERRAAEAVLKLGGRLDVFGNDEVKHVKQATELPGEPFVIIKIDLRDDQRGGPIPAGSLEPLAPLRHVEHLRLEGTQVTGEDLRHIRDMAALEFLHLGGSRIEDADLIHLAELTKLEDLDLSWNTRLTGDGLVHLGKLTKLRNLSLYVTSSTDEGLNHLRNLPSLERLVLHETKITGRSLPTFRCWSNLRTLLLGRTAAGDTILEGVKRCPKLTQLDIYDCRKITDAGLAHLADLDQFDWLVLKGGRYTNAGLVHLTKMKRLVSLDLSGSPVSDVNVLATLPKLRALHLNDTKVTGPGLARLRECPSLRSLVLNRTPIGDQDLEILSTFENVVGLPLAGTRITDAGLAKVHRMKQLERIAIEDTRVTEAGRIALRAALPNVRIRQEP